MTSTLDQNKPTIYTQLYSPTPLAPLPLKVLRNILETCINNNK